MIDVIFCVHNRYAFTYLSLSWIIRTIDTGKINKFWVLDDGSSDGVTEYLRDITTYVLSEMMPTEYVRVDFRSLSQSVGFVVEKSNASVICKLDNDLCIMEKRWLKKMSKVLKRRQELCCLGIANPQVISGIQDTIADDDVRRGYVVTKHIGGIGLFRRDMLSSYRLKKRKRGDRAFRGLQKAQKRDKRLKGWYIPFIRTELLDRPDKWQGRQRLDTLNAHYRVQHYSRSSM